MSTHETDWPCATDPSADLPDRLVAALYVLARDHVAPGDLEQVMLNVGRHPTAPLKVAYSNPHLLALAQAHATFLLEGFRTSYPYKEGDWLILGPQCFLTLSDDGKGVHTINYQGQNFVPQEGSTAILVDDDSSHIDSERCPRCGSPDPARHPATSFEGEVQPCTDPWHDIERDGLPEPKTIEDGQTLDEQVAAAYSRAGGVSTREEEVGVIELMGGDIVYKDKHYTPLTLDDATGQGRR